LLQLVVDIFEGYVLRCNFLVELLALLKETLGVGQLANISHQDLPELGHSSKLRSFWSKQRLDVTSSSKDVLHVDPGVLQLDPTFNDCTKQREVFLHLLSFGSKLASVATGQNHVDVRALRVESLVYFVECNQLLVLLLVGSRVEADLVPRLVYCIVINLQLCFTSGTRGDGNDLVLELDDVQINEVLQLKGLIFDVDFALDELVNLCPVLWEQIGIPQG